MFDLKQFCRYVIAVSESFSCMISINEVPTVSKRLIYQSLLLASIPGKRERKGS